MDHHSGGGHYHSGRAKPFDPKASKLQSTSLLASPVKGETDSSGYMAHMMMIPSQGRYQNSPPHQTRRGAGSKNMPQLVSNLQN